MLGLEMKLLWQCQNRRAHVVKFRCLSVAVTVIAAASFLTTTATLVLAMMLERSNPSTT